jgi:hypothetical protein
MQRILTALGLLLAISSAAHATTLTTGILYGARPTALHGRGSTYCSLTNVGARNVDAAVRVLDSIGLPLSASSFALAPGASQITAAHGFNVARCELVISASGRSVRATGCAAVDLEGCQALEAAR